MTKHPSLSSDCRLAGTRSIHQVWHFVLTAFGRQKASDFQSLEATSPLERLSIESPKLLGSPGRRPSAACASDFQSRHVLPPSGGFDGKSAPLQGKLRTILLLLFIFTLPQNLRASTPPSRSYEELVEIVRHGQGASRADAVRDLAREGKRAIPVLIEILGDRDLLVRKRAAEALGALGGVGLSALDKEMRADDASRRRNAVQAMGRIGESALPYIETLLKESRPSLRLTAVHALGAVGKEFPDAVRDNLVLATEDPDFQVRMAAARLLPSVDSEALPKQAATNDPVEAIASIRNLAARGKAAASELEALADHPNEQVRSEAVKAIGRLGADGAAPLTTLLASDRVDVRKQALLELAAIPDVERLPLRQALDDRSEEVRKTAVESLSSLHDEPAATFFPLFDDPKRSVRLAALKASIGSGGAGRKQAAEAILHDDRHIGLPAVETLSATGKEALPELSLLATSADDDRVRAAAVAAAGTLGAESLPAIAQALDDGSDRVRLAAVRELRRFPSEAATLLIQAASHKDPEIRREAAKGLALLDEGGTKALDSLLDDKEESVRLAAVHELARLSEEAIAPLGRALFDSDADVREAAVSALVAASSGHDSDFLVKSIGPLVDDENRDVRIVACRALARFGDAAVPPLLRAAGDRTESVRKAALQALLAIAPASSEAMEAFRQSADDSDLTIAELGIKGLTLAGDRAIPALRELDGSPRPRIRAAAYRALGRLPAPNASIIANGLDDEEASVRIAALTALGRALDPPVDRIAYLLDDDHPAVRQAAVTALASAGPPAFERLESVVKGSDPNLAEKALAAAVRFGPAARRLFEIAAAHSLRAVRLTAAGAIAFTGNESLATAADLLSDKEPGVAKRMARGLAPYCENGLELLLVAASSADATIRAAASSSAGFMGPPAAGLLTVSLGDPDPAVRKSAVAAVAELLQGNACDMLKPLLRDDDGSVRAAATAAMVKAGCSATAPPTEDESVPRQPTLPRKKLGGALHKSIR